MTRYKDDAYQQVMALRRRGFTYTEIARICNVSRGTISNWLKAEPFSKTVAHENSRRAVMENKKRLQLINKARSSERARQYREAERIAVIEYRNYATSPLFIAGLMVYASIGDTHQTDIVRLTSAQPELQRIFFKFITTYLGVDVSNVHFWILLYPQHDESTCVQHWCTELGIANNQFYKNQVVKSRTTKKTLHFGVLNTIIGSTLQKRRLLVWLNLAKKEFTTA